MILIFRWYIDNNDNDDLTEDDDFNVGTPSLVGGQNYGDFIESYESNIKFDVNDKLLEKLGDQNG